MHDANIRSSLLKMLNKQYIDSPNTLILNELGLCQGLARIDVAVISEVIIGYEIKSDRDTLDRLPQQIEVYSKTLDFAHIVTCDKHLGKVMSMVPCWWGVWNAQDNQESVTLSVIRKSAQNPFVSPRSLVELLWKDESYGVLEEYGIHRGMKSKNRDVLWDKLADCVPLEELRSIVVQRLKARENWRRPVLTH